MASVSIIHYTSMEYKDGTSPIVIRVIENRKPKKRTLANVLPAQWDDKKKRVIPKSHPNYAIINIRISDEYNRIEGLILANKFDLQRDFVDYFDNPKSDIEPTEENGLSFKEIIPLYVSQLKSGQSMIAYESRLNYFVENSGIGNLRLSEINKSHVDKFIAFMEKEGNKRSTMRTKIKIVRFMASFAAKNGYDIKNEVLFNFPLPTPERSIKSKLSKDEFELFRSFKCKTDKQSEVQDAFALAVFLRGMRIGDVIQIKREYFKDGRFVYESQKNEKQFNIKLRPEALGIVNRHSNGEYLFSFYKHIDDTKLGREQNLKNYANHIKSITAYINKVLKEIASDAGVNKVLSSHKAKHTFSKFAIDTVKDINLGMDLIGNSSLKEYQTYIRELSQDEQMDDAADIIFG